MKKSAFLIISLFLIFTITAYSQSFYSPVQDLSGYSSIYIQAGSKLNSSSSASVSITGIKTDVQFVGFIGYQYWINNEWSLNSFAGAFKAASSVSIGNVSSISIYPAMFGASFYPEDLTLGDIGRVYFAASLGVYNGSATKAYFSFSNVGTEVTNESVFGAAVGAGIDLFFFDWLRLGPSLSYHFVTEFSEVVGDRNDYSGPVFAFSAGVLF